ncbi:MAG: PQQ-binding-like beta-propeller repeat protein, partial [Rhodothermales bacterium]
NLFANSVVALDAATGERRWHFQAVRHDVWDYDLATSPNLVTVRREGLPIDAVAQPTKVGHLFVLDRETGEPLYPIEEQAVPSSTLDGEKLSPTQPFSSIVYAQQGFGEANRNTLTPESDAFSKQLIEEYGEAGLFPAPSREGDVILPQFNGGTDWGGASYDPSTDMLYVNASNEAEFLQMFEASETDEHDHPFIDGGHQPLRGPDGYPVNQPPWGTLTAIDLSEGRIDWQVPLGTYLELEEEGLSPTGTFNMGGSVVTAGGLVFIAAAMDERIRAFDKTTGELLWQADLPAGGYATPATYAVDGVQYLVVAAGGGGKPGTQSGDSYVAFALPESERN